MKNFILFTLFFFSLFANAGPEFGAVNCLTHIPAAGGRPVCSNPDSIINGLGTSTTPSYTFSSHTGTGFYLDTNAYGDVFSFSVNGLGFGNMNFNSGTHATPVFNVGAPANPAIVSAIGASVNTNGMAFSGTCNTTSGSTAVTNLQIPAGSYTLWVGSGINGPNITPGTTVSAISGLAAGGYVNSSNNPVSLTLSQNATGTATGAACYGNAVANVFTGGGVADSTIFQSDGNDYTGGHGGSMITYSRSHPTKPGYIEFYNDGLLTGFTVGGSGSRGNWTLGNSSSNQLSILGNVSVSGTTATTVPYLNSSKVLTSSAVTPTQLGYLSAATGTTGTSSTNLVFSSSPTIASAILSGVTTHGNGTVSAPSIIFADSGTGLYRSSTNQIAFATNGVQSGKTDSAGDWYLGNPSGTSTIRVQGTDVQIGLAAAQTYNGIYTGANRTSYLAVAGGDSYGTSAAGVTLGGGQIYLFGDQHASKASKIEIYSATTQTATFSGANVNIPGLTASQAVFTDSSKNLTSNAITGTGSVVMSASPTMTGTAVHSAASFSGDATFSANIKTGSSGKCLLNPVETDIGNTGTAQSIDLSTGNVWTGTLTGNLTVTFSNAIAGCPYVFVWTQDGTGSRTLTHAGVTTIWGNSGAKTLTTTVAAIDKVTCVYNGALSKLMCDLATVYQ